MSSPPFLLLGAVSPSADVIMPPRSVMLPSYGANTSLLPLLHILTILRPVTSLLELKLKY
jgi:hypothetical protein